MPVLSILVVDDDIQYRRLLERIISGAGHVVEQISKPTDLFDRYDQLAPDIIFLDIFMPDFDGIQVARWLVEKRFKGRLVFMTGHDTCFLRAARISVQQETEADVVTLEKPARVEQILDLISDQGTSSGIKTRKGSLIAYHNDKDSIYSKFPTRVRNLPRLM